MTDDSKFDAFLRRHEPRAPSKPDGEWSALRSRLTRREVSWREILSNTLRAADFWIPSVGLTSLALAGAMVLSRIESAPTTSDTVGHITETFTTDLAADTAYDAKIMSSSAD